MSTEIDNSADPALDITEIIGAMAEENENREQVYLYWNDRYYCGAEGVALADLKRSLGIGEDDFVQLLTEEQYLNAVFPPSAQMEESLKTLDDHVETRLNRFARVLGYDSIVAAASYATDPDPVYATEGQKAVQSRSEQWQAWIPLREKILAGDMDLPTTEQLDALLPPLTWA